jgi:hypothetical protein
MDELPFVAYRASLVETVALFWFTRAGDILARAQIDALIHFCNDKSCFSESLSLAPE